MLKCKAREILTNKAHESDTPLKGDDCNAAGGRFASAYCKTSLSHSLNRCHDFRSASFR